jgi:ubiquitin-like-conjugating enzyme ATG3
MISSLRNWREHLTPVSGKSDFKETGQLSPEAFVLAGDYLVHQFPTWLWQAAQDDKVMRDFLPRDKQFLITRNVACATRADKLLSDTQEEIDTEDGFVNTFSVGANQAAADMPDIADLSLKSSRPEPSVQDYTATSDDALPDLEDFAMPDDEDDPHVLRQSNVVSTRTYDLYITYDKYYRTPRMWLFGWSERGTPLTVNEVWQDISGDHVGKTVTMETFPHSSAGVQMASVHPCKHSSVMKVFIERANEQALVKQRKEARNQVARGDDEGIPVEEGIRVDLYLVIFLKFIATITPTIEHESGTFYV